MMYPNNTSRLRAAVIGLIALTSDQWFCSPVPSEMLGFCEHLAVFLIDNPPNGEFVRKCGVFILFEMLCSPERKQHIVPRFWGMLTHSPQVPEGRESFWWCFRKAIGLLVYERAA